MWSRINVFKESFGFFDIGPRAKGRFIMFRVCPSLKMLKKLIVYGAPLFAVNTAGLTAEEVARKNDFIEAADFLAEEMKKAEMSRSDKK